MILLPPNYCRASAALIALLLTACAVRAEEKSPATGPQIFAAQCARCHGAAGQGGTEECPGPLVGDKSILELTRLIEKTMPEDKPGTCTGSEAHAVAAYIHEAFYSPAARERHRPARVELSRLTVRQYQNALADVLAAFRPVTKIGNERGLKARYYATGRLRRGSEAVLERIDPQVNFDFGVESPVPEKMMPAQFSISWEGSLLAPESGDYDIVLRTQHATRLWLNDDRTNENRLPLIDAWVKSGDDQEYRATIRLIGGRVYPLRLEFSKAHQGTQEAKDRKDGKQEIPAAISLCWQMPHRPVEVIDSRWLLPERVPEVFVVQAAFPPDDRSVGYERGNSISKAWDAATTEGALEAVAHVISRLEQLASIGGPPATRDPRLVQFCEKFAAAAFRRPLTDEQRTLYVERQFAADDDALAAVKRSLLLVLKSPRFLYREAHGEQTDPFTIAERLAFALWDSVPDAELIAAAKEGKLGTRDDVLAQARRMLPDLRARAKLRTFFQQWLKIDGAADLSKDSKRYPEFTPEVAADLRTSLELFVEDVLWSDEADFRRLLLADELPLNGRLAKFYGVGERAAETADDEFALAKVDADHRAGVLTHPYLLTTFAYTGTSSPIHRGVFISRSLLGRTLKPPPEAVTPLAPELQPNLTTRERIALQTKSESCLSCHNMINPLGFTLEHFDAVGRFRRDENGKPIDDAGAYITRDGQEVQFDGVRDLAHFLADSPETHAAFCEHLFQFLINQPVRAYGPTQLNELRTAFARENFNMQKLVLEIAVTAAMVDK